MWHDIRELERAAEHFETEIYTRIRAAFGSEWTPGIDNNQRITILHATGLGEDVMGYASGLDAYPSDVHPQSNEREMITVNVEAVDVGSPSYDALLARELLRLIQWHEDRNEERWVREGLAELAATFVGSQPEACHQAYLQQPDTSLTAWIDDERHRGATHLFLAYFHGRFGEEGTRTLTAEPANGISGFGAALQQLEAELVFEDLFADWLAANYVGSISRTVEARYRYPSLDIAQPTHTAIYETYPLAADTAVHQFGADYVVLRGGEDLRVRFIGQQQTPLLAQMPPTDHPVWWSNRADESRTTLTGSFDLQEVDQAILTYRVWYDIEPHFDYALVEISADGGRQWHILQAPSGTDANPYHNNPGWAYTGSSDDWIEEEIDISAYAGGDVLIRFSYLTDGAITGEGLLLDDIAVATIDDQGEIEDGTNRWDAAGFILTDGLVPQSYLALLISRGKSVSVERLQLENDQSAEWTIPLASDDLQEAVLILSATAPLTEQPAPYQLRITR